MAEFETADDLRAYLNGILVGGGDSAAVLVNGSLWLAYCTDPDGEWFFESGDPRERLDDDGLYERIGFPFLGPQIDAHGGIVLWPLAPRPEKGSERG